MMPFLQLNKNGIERSIRASVRAFSMRAALSVVALVLFIAGLGFLGVVGHAQLVKWLGPDAANLVMGFGLITLSAITLLISAIKPRKRVMVVATDLNPEKSKADMLASLAFTIAFVAARQMRRR